MGLQADGCGRKLRCATLVMEGLWELVAQLVEQRTFNAWVSGSIPDELTTRWPPTLLKMQSQLPPEKPRGVSGPV